MNYMINKIMEKHAGQVSNWWSNLDHVKNYRAVKASPSFKAKRILGTAALASLPIAYGAHKLTEGPKEMPGPTQAPEVPRYNVM
jgi:hypothetical protein